MALGDIKGQQRAVRFLKQLVRRDMVPHAFLFTGMPGTGRLAAAFELARALECLDPQDSDSCGQCGACRKIDQGIHPDLIQVRSDGAFIKIEQIRELRERFRFRPFEGKWRIVIIQDAQRLREEAANAILKVLEEPPRGNLFILIAPEAQMLLPTIVSRCCQVRFQPLGDDIVADWLVRESGLSIEDAAEVARLSAGSLDAARRLTEEDRIAGWKRVLANVESLERLSLLDLFSMTAKWGGTREQVEKDLECIRLWARDLIVLRLGGNRPLTFELDQGTVEAVRDIAPERLFRLYHDIEEATRNLKINVNLQLTLEGICLAIKDSLYGKGDWHSFSKGRQNLPL